MISKIRTYFSVVIVNLNNNIDVIKILGLPIVLFILDIILRSSMKIDLTDAGADMALFALSIFLSIAIEGSHRLNIVIILLFIFLFAILWISCLAIISSDNLQLQIPNFTYDFRGIFCWFFGLSAFFLANFLADQIRTNTEN